MKMNKWLLTGIVLWVLWTAWVYATLNINTTINNLYSYVKKLILTDNGTIDGTQKIVLDGSNGSISMSGALNIQEGALKDNTIVSSDIKNGEIKNADIANGAVDSAKVKDNSLTANDLAPNSVWASELANNAVDTAAIKNNAITSEKIKNGEIKNVDIANGAVTEDKLDSNLRSKINNTLSEEDIENMGFKKFVTTCNSANLGKRRRSDLKICIFSPKTVLTVYAREVKPQNSRIWSRQFCEKKCKKDNRRLINYYFDEWKWIIDQVNSDWKIDCIGERCKYQNDGTHLTHNGDNWHYKVALKCLCTSKYTWR